MTIETKHNIGDKVMVTIDGGKSEGVITAISVMPIYDIDTVYQDNNKTGTRKALRSEKELEEELSTETD